jgi:adenine-specific DNA glycosylase
VRTVSYVVLVTLNPVGELLMVRRPPNGLLGGLWEFPAVEIGPEDGVAAGGRLRVADSREGDSLHGRYRVRLEDLGVQLPSRTVRLSVLPEVRHAFTHLKAVYRPMLVVGARSWEPPGSCSDRSARSEVLTPEGLTVEELPADGLPAEERKWVLPDQAEHLPLPVAQRKILDLAWAAVEALEA